CVLDIHSLPPPLRNLHSFTLVFFTTLVFTALIFPSQSRPVNMIRAASQIPSQYSAEQKDTVGFHEREQDERSEDISPILTRANEVHHRPIAGA
ncbi:hypothetical protein KUCAC02_033927, partial [Chaenocephalus aceratus]